MSHNTPDMQKNKDAIPSASVLSTIQIVSTYILDVIDHLYQTHNITLKLLFICHPDVVATLKPLLAKHNKMLDSTSDFFTPDFFTPEEFAKLTFNKRYHLGCLIDLNNVSVIPKSHASETTHDFFADKDKHVIEQNSHISVASMIVRLRDLFAEHSVVIIPKNQVSVLNLPSYGFMISAANHKTQAKNINLQLYQFNLFDYKPKPKWLNARYWANPENYNKYRW